jgi:hypothetical protein
VTASRENSIKRCVMVEGPEASLEKGSVNSEALVGT